jgi:hypothetical protein
MGSHHCGCAGYGHITVLNADTGSLVGDIQGLQGSHSVALATELRRGFATNGRANTLTIFDLRTLNPIATVRTGTEPDAVVYDMVSKTAFSLNVSGRSVTAINAINGGLRGTLRVADRPGSAVADGRGNLYVSLTDSAEIAVFNTETLSLRRRMRLASCLEPASIALDVEHGTLYTGCVNQMIVVTDAVTGHLLAQLPTSGRTSSVVFDSDQHLAFAANGEGTLTVVREESLREFSIVENVATRHGARTIAIDSQKHRILLATAGLQSAAQIEEIYLVKPDSSSVLIAGK